MRAARAFTLIEMLVVMSILAMLMGLTVAAVSIGRQHAKKKTAEIEMQTISAALQQYENDWRDYPDANGYLDGPNDYESIETLYQALRAPVKYGPYLKDDQVKTGDINRNGKPEILDPWELPYRYIHNRWYGKDGPEGKFLLQSAGADEEYNTDDDIWSGKHKG